MKRKVIVHKYSEDGDKVAVDNGIFHEFGCGYEVLEDGIGNYSTALVEMPDGSIENVPVELIVMRDNSVIAIDQIDQVRMAFLHQLERKTGWGRNEIKHIFEMAVDSVGL